jgi:hypothetical protein
MRKRHAFFIFSMCLFLSLFSCKRALIAPSPELAKLFQPSRLKTHVTKLSTDWSPRDWAHPNHLDAIADTLKPNLKTPAGA